MQIIGWLYQYYNAEKKNEVFAALKKNVKITRENIPAATQLFTPDWIVRYMVENSLGRLFIDKRKNEGIHADGRGPDEMTWEEIEAKRIETEKFISKQMDWKYYLPEAQQEPEVQEQLAEIRKEYAAMKPEEIKCIDPCCGSGHILCYLFDVLMQIYESYGYTTREAVRSIIENNLYGLDIDDRAAQLAYFAVMMKARQYDRRFLSRKYAGGEPDVPQPHVYAIRESNRLDRDVVEYFVGDDSKRKQEFDILMEELQDAKEYGSILTITPVDFAALYARIDEVIDDISLYKDAILSTVWPLIQVAETLVQKYDVVVANPPYMGSSNMSAKLSEFVKKNYPDSKSDLFAVFMECCGKMTARNRYQAMITQHAWMFLSSFEKLRIKLLQKDTVNMAHLGIGTFEDLNSKVVQSVAFIKRNRHISHYVGSYNRLFERQGLSESSEEKQKWLVDGSHKYKVCQDNFSKIPGSPVAYWVSEKMISCYKYKSIYEYATPCKGIDTGDNDLFLRLWYEVDLQMQFVPCGTQCSGDDFATKKWFPYNKGGDYRKWYGNNEYLLNWENNGKFLRAFKGSNLRNKDKYFLRGITWSTVTSGMSSFRYFDYGFLFDNGGSCLYTNTNLLYIQGFLNSCVAKLLLGMSPTLNTQPGNIGALPLALMTEQVSVIEKLVQSNIAISRADWDSFETSWDFTVHPLVRCKEFSPQEVEEDEKQHITDMNLIDCAFTNWDNECYLRFTQLKANEEELNRIFIDIYGLQDELTPEVDDKDVTVRRANLGRDIRSLISYAVGCMFGRYSLYKEGLIYAGGKWDYNKFEDLAWQAEGKPDPMEFYKAGAHFFPDQDNVIPICDDEYFPDDIVGRFVEFISIVYGSDTLEENLRFIADALGGKGQPKDVIRNFFLNDFYTDHLKIYQKRPIYWLFDSGKKNGFKALIYMHRYQPDTIARMRTDYVHEQQSRYRTAIADLEQRIAAASTSERVKLSKKLKTLQEQATEIQGYEEKIHHLADQYIAIDLDDGVKVNYAKFQDVLAKIK